MKASRAGKQIAAKLKAEGRSLTWLASQIGVSVQYVSNMLKGTQPLLDCHVKAINQVLNTNFTNEQKKSTADVS